MTFEGFLWLSLFVNSFLAYEAYESRRLFKKKPPKSSALAG